MSKSKKSQQQYCTFVIRPNEFEAKMRILFKNCKEVTFCQHPQRLDGSVFMLIDVALENDMLATYRVVVSKTSDEWINDKIHDIMCDDWDLMVVRPYSYKFPKGKLPAINSFWLRKYEEVTNVKK